MWRKPVLAAIMLCGSAYAAAANVELDGCAELSRVVYDEVQASALYGPGKSGPWFINPGQGEIYVCETVAKTVSRAFTLAMDSAGYSVSWSSLPLYDDQICDSVIIDHCLPDTSGPYPPFAATSNLIPGLWNVVATTVMREMHNPHSGDELRFRVDDLRLQLGLALRTVGTRQRGVIALPSQQ